tara:strand:+ start:223 stop:816 length:594 start_codon:yes stop_codon:yes gene_type:complete
MPITINGTGTVTGLAVGGLPDGCVDRDTLATAAKGSILQVLQDVKTDQFQQNISNNSTFDIPGLSQAITLSSSSNKVLIQVTLSCSTSTSGYNGVCWWLNRNTSSTDYSLAIGDQVGSNRGRASCHPGVVYDAVHQHSEGILYLDTPGSVGAHTYSLKGKNHSSQSTAFNVNQGNSNADDTGKVTTFSSITVMEIAG